MRLQAFKVEMYRSIIDSGWVEVDDLTAIVGKNESGKTAILRALHKFNPLVAEEFDIENDWPHDRRDERTDSHRVVSTRFVFEDADKAAISQWSKAAVEGAEISKDYRGAFEMSFFPEDEVFESYSLEGIQAEYESSVSELILRYPILEEGILGVMRSGAEVIRNETQLEDLASLLDHVPNEIPLPAALLRDIHDEIVGIVKDAVAKSKLIDAREHAMDFVEDSIPKFVYLEEHVPFRGTASINELKTRSDNETLVDEDKTFLMLLNMAGLDLETEYSRANNPNKSARMLDMNDASARLTTLLAGHWSQRNYEVAMRADGEQMVTFISDDVQTAWVPLEERSKGFQWFFSFDTTFLHETEGNFADAIVLLDEPGLHLHSTAQEDLLSRLKQYSATNQIIYTTHMPHMVDIGDLGSIRACVAKPGVGTLVTDDIWGVEKNDIFPLHAVMGLSIAQTLFVGKYNLIVEGITDFWFIDAMSNILRNLNKTTLREDIVVTPAGGASKTVYLATMLCGQSLNVVVLLDADRSGEDAKRQLVNKWIVDSVRMLSIKDILEKDGASTIEDLFDPVFYISNVNVVCAEKLNGVEIAVDEVLEDVSDGIVVRVDEIMKSRGISTNSEGHAFNKGSVAKLIMRGLGTVDDVQITESTVENFEKLFVMINEKMAND